jgi:hypothetical protein
MNAGSSRGPTGGPIAVKRKQYSRWLFPWLFVPAALSPAWAQPMTLADLEGAVIDVRLLREQRISREGREFSNQFQSDFKLEIGPAGRIRSTFSPTAYTSKGTRTGKVMSGWFTLEQPREVKTSGSGHGVWIFDDGTLTYLRTFHGGGLKMVVTFARNTGEFTCRASESFLREEGVRGIVLESAIDGVPAIVLSAKPISGNCRISKQPTGIQPTAREVQ